ncbi:hypothetical protein AGOR_G00029660 [Albula goreensis]|uniref:Uncharacterized protein n=1 Tax=Albula goreensis TaxID=1534307 RepID=A0A8T3E601_9TELE|nr:hypothetical protein AGOR_G00029660 [Albula goreensis]
MLRFRFFLPLMAPVLAVIGWWLYTSRKKKEIVAPKEEKEGLAARELASPCQVGNGAVEGSRVKLEEVNMQQEIVDKNHVPIATAVMLGQSLPIETLGSVGTLSNAHSSSHAGDSDGNDPESESSEQEVTFKPPVPSLPKTGIEKAGQDDLSRSECQLLHGDKQVIVASEHGPEAELAVANEEQEQLAPPPSQSHSAGISPTLAQLTEAEGNDDAVNIMVPSPEDLQTAASVEPIHSLNEDLSFTELQTSTGRMPDLLFPKTDITSSHILAPLASQPMLEAEVPPQQDGFGEPLASGQPSEPAREESKGPILGLNSEVISVAMQEVRLHGDVGEDGDGRTSDQNNSFSLSDGTDCTTVEQVEWENSQTSTAVTCLLEDHRDEHENDQMSNKSDLLVNGPSLSASVDVHHEEEKVRSGCLAPLVPEGAKEDIGSSRTESGQKSPRPELTPPCPDDDVTERKDCGFDTCHSEDRVSNEDQLPTLGLSHKVPEKDDNPVLSTVTSPGSNEQKHSPEISPEPSLERGHQEATLSWGESATNTDPHDASLTDKEMEAVHSREIPLAAPQEVPAVSHSESAGEEVHQTSCEQSSSCVITNGTQCTEPDQALQKSDLANRTQCSVPGQKEQENDHTDGTQCVALEQHEQENGQPSETQCIALDQTHQEEEQTSSERQPIPQVPTDVTEDGVFQNGRCTAPVGQKVEDDASSSGRTDSGEKNPRPTPSPPSTDKPQTDDDVTETEDSGCGTCQSEDGLNSEDQLPASGLSREVPERNTDPMRCSVTSQNSEEQRAAQSRSPERASETCHQETCLSGGEKLSDTDLRNGSHSENETGGRSLQRV